MEARLLRTVGPGSNSTTVTAESVPFIVQIVRTEPPALLPLQVAPATRRQLHLSLDNADGGGGGNGAELASPQQQLSPAAPPHECVITDAPYSAKPDNKTINTAAIQRAIDACHDASPDGSRVVVPPGALNEERGWGGPMLI